MNVSNNNDSKLHKIDPLEFEINHPLSVIWDISEENTEEEPEVLNGNENGNELSEDIIPSENSIESQIELFVFAKNILGWNGTLLNSDLYLPRIDYLKEVLSKSLEEISEDMKEEVEQYLLLASIYIFGVSLNNPGMFSSDGGIEIEADQFNEDSWSMALIAMGLVYPQSLMIGKDENKIVNFSVSEMRDGEGIYYQIIDGVSDDERPNIIKNMLQRLDGREYIQNGNRFVEVDISFNDIVRNIYANLTDL